jgi:hypothetical protein
VGNKWSRIEGSVVFVGLNTKSADGGLKCSPFGGDNTNHFSFEERRDVLKRDQVTFIIRFVSSVPKESEYYS